MKRLLLLVLLGTLIGVWSCSKDDNDDPMDGNADCNNVDITYASGIKAIIDANCALPACHGGNASLPDFTNYANAFSRRSLIQSRVVGRSMPPAGSPALSSENIEKINCWVQNGAPE